MSAKVYLVVVGGVLESEREHALLLEVGLVDTGEALHDNGATTKMAGLKSSVFATASLTVVLVTNDNPALASGLVLASDVCGRDEL